MQATEPVGKIDPAPGTGGRRPSPDAASSEQALRVVLRDLRRILDTIELDEPSVRVPRGDPELLAFSRRMIGERARRFRFFDGHLFSDPAWDIMLDLFVAGIERREVPVTNLCLTSNVPDTTVLRWIRTLCAEGLAVRHKDGIDRRRVLVQLSPAAAEAMRLYVEEQMAAADKMHAVLHRDGGMSLGV